MLKNNIFLLLCFFIIFLIFAIYGKHNISFLIISILIFIIVFYYSLSKLKVVIIMSFSTLIIFLPLIFEPKINNEINHNSKILEVYNSSFLVKEDNVNYYIIYNKTANLYIDQDVEFKCSYKKINFDKDFNNFLNSKRVEGYCNIDSLSIVKESNKISSEIEKKLNESNMIYINDFFEILFFNSNNLKTDFLKNIEKIGILHLFTISGFHISVIYYSIIFFKKNKRTKKNLIITFMSSIPMILLLQFTNFPLNANRAFLNYILVSLMGYLELKNYKVKSHLLSYILLLIINPYNIFNIGIWISFCSITTILISNKFLNINNKVVKKIIVSFFVYLVSTIVASSISEYYNYLSFIWIFFFTPLMELLFIVSLPIILLPGLWSIFDEILHWLFLFSDFLCQIETYVINEWNNTLSIFINVLFYIVTIFISYKESKTLYATLPINYILSALTITNL